MIGKIVNQKGWFFVLPVVILVAFNALIPLMTVVYYSVQETFGNNLFFWEGLGWFEKVLHSERFQASLLRQFTFTFIILVIEIPLGVAIALAMPRKGPWVSVCLVLMALPLLIPWNVVGAMWNIFSLPDIGLLGKTLNSLGFDYDYTQQPLSAWFTVILMDVWHWTSLVVLLAYAGLCSIPEQFYQAAKIDGASPWAIFRYIELPKMRRVLLIGSTAGRLAGELDATAKRMGRAAPSIFREESLEAAYRAGLKALDGSGVLLFSPGCASFDMFPNYKVRGERFQALVEAREE